MIQLIAPKNGEMVDTHTPIQNMFIEKIRSHGIDAALQWLLPEKGRRECTCPQKCTLRWTAEGVAQYTVELSEGPDFSFCRVYHTGQTCLEVTNLKIGQTYFWRVNGSAASCFTTEDNAFRFIEIDGLPNVRDIGGIHIRQGLLYRGSEMDWEYHITPAGKRTFCEELGIKTQLYLRKEMQRTEMQLERVHSVAGEGVLFKRLPYRPYKEVFEPEHRENIRHIFDFLADEVNYPIYFHCRGGADRTGMIALYLRALAGEPQEAIFTDYELTSLSNYNGGAAEGTPAEFRSRKSDYFVEFLTMLREETGQAKLQDMVYTFLLHCGVTEQTIDKVLQILKK